MATLAPPRPIASLREERLPWAKHLDWGILGAVAGLAGVGLLTIYSVTGERRRAVGLDPYIWVERQLVLLTVAATAMTVVIAIGYHRLREVALPIYIASCITLALLPVIGDDVNGARAWFDIGPFQMQPVEFTKVALILALAVLIANERDEELPFTRFVGALAVLALPGALVLLQPDLGSTSVLVAITMGILLVGRANPKHIILVTALAIFSVVFIVATDTLSDYQYDRFTTFVDGGSSGIDDVSRQVTNSQQAITLGKLTGEGFMKGPYTRGGYVAEQRTDFVFSAIAEQFGFLGAAGVLALFALLFLRIWRVAQLARDMTGTLICVGVLCVLVWHVFENVGMSMGIMPITGIPLPFVSYGGSSTIAFFIMIGLVESVHLRKI
jgi:rod shape determining protein RodA